MLVVRAEHIAFYSSITFFMFEKQAVPCLSALAVDPDKNVRDHVFKALKAFIEKLQQASDDPEKAAKLGI